MNWPRFFNATASPALHTAITVGGDVVLGVACFVGLFDYWQTQIAQVVRLEFGAVLLTCGLWLAESSWRADAKSWGDRLMLMFCAIAVGVAVLWGLFTVGSLSSRIWFVVLVAHRVLAGIRSKELVNRSVVSAVLLLLVLGLVAKGGGVDAVNALADATSPWLLLGAAYFFGWAWIGWIVQSESIPPSKRPPDVSAA